MNATIGILGTFDSKAEELLFLRDVVAANGLRPITINLGTKEPVDLDLDFDLFHKIPPEIRSRDQRIEYVIREGRSLVLELLTGRALSGAISAGGGSGTYLATEVMKALPLGLPKVMVSTVASKDMSRPVGTKDITMIHSVFDMLGVTSLSAMILEEAASAVCAMANIYLQKRWKKTRPRIALTMFGFITEAAMNIKGLLEEKGYEVIPFHANGTGGLAMEELCREGYFDAVLDLATHELADTLKNGYCTLIGEGRLENKMPNPPPRLVVVGGLDCAVLVFDRTNIPMEYRGRQIFFYDFRSAVRLSKEETIALAHIFVNKVNTFGNAAKVLIPTKGWSEADGEGKPLYNPELSELFIEITKSKIREAEILFSNHHINDKGFALEAVAHLEKMLC